MYGIYTYIYHKNQPNVGKYTMHGSYGVETTTGPGNVLPPSTKKNQETQDIQSYNVSEDRLV